MWGAPKKVLTPGVQAQQPGLGEWMGEVRGQKNIFMFCKHIWIPHEILSILSINTWRKNEILQPHHMLKQCSCAFSAKSGSDLLNANATQGHGC